MQLIHAMMQQDKLSCSLRKPSIIEYSKLMNQFIFHKRYDLHKPLDTSTAQQAILSEHSKLNNQLNLWYLSQVCTSIGDYLDLQNLFPSSTCMWEQLFPTRDQST